MDMLRFSVNIK